MGATLLYTDSYEKVTIQVFRKLLNHDVFGTEPMQVGSSTLQLAICAFSAALYSPGSDHRLQEATAGNHSGLRHC